MLPRYCGAARSAEAVGCNRFQPFEEFHDVKDTSTELEFGLVALPLIRVYIIYYFVQLRLD